MEWVVGGLEMVNPAFYWLAIVVLEFAVAVASSGCLGEGVETAFGAVNGGKADIDTGFDELCRDEDDCFSLFAQAFGAGEDEHDVAGAHAGGKVEGVGVRAEFFVEGLGGFGGVKYEQAAEWGLGEDVGDEIPVIERAKVVAFDPLKDLEEIGFVPDDGEDFPGRDADLEVLPLFERWLGGGAEDGGGVKIVDEAGVVSCDQIAGEVAPLVGGGGFGGTAGEHSGGEFGGVLGDFV